MMLFSWGGCYWLSSLRPSCLTQVTLMRLPKLVPGAGAIAAACPCCAHSLACVMMQGASLRIPKSVAGARADAATGPPYLLPSGLLLGALMRLPKLVSGAGAISAACPFCAHPLAGVLVQGASLRQPQNVTGACADVFFFKGCYWLSYLRPSCLTLVALMRLEKLVPVLGLQLLALLCLPFGWRFGADGPTAPSLISC